MNRCGDAMGCNVFRFWLPAWGAVAAVVAGCGGLAGNAAHLQGTVTLNGKPIPADAKAYVVFVPDVDKTKAVSAPVTGGRYDLPNAPMGLVMVHFEVTREVGPEKTSERTGQVYRDVVSLVPARLVTGLPVQVVGDDTSLDFDLSDRP
jgi:hypothetical protein